jgi:hypothetical protein
MQKHADHSLLETVHIKNAFRVLALVAALVAVAGACGGHPPVSESELCGGHRCDACIGANCDGGIDGGT